MACRTGWPLATVLRERVIARAGQLLGQPAGRPARFVETLGAVKP